MKILPTICALSILSALAGCAGVTADVDARGSLPEASPRGVNYRFARTPAQADAGANSPYEALLRDGLAKRGFVEGPPEAAGYLVSVAWSTRPASVTVKAGECEGGCAGAAAPSFPWFGRPYVHTLTLRFFALPDGTEAYRVSVVKHDRDADAQQALPYLVAGALARLPYAGTPPWRVKLRESGAGGAQALPDVVSVKSVAPAQ